MTQRVTSLGLEVLTVLSAPVRATSVGGEALTVLSSPVRATSLALEALTIMGEAPPTHYLYLYGEPGEGEVAHYYDSWSGVPNADPAEGWDPVTGSGWAAATSASCSTGTITPEAGETNFISSAGGYMGYDSEMRRDLDVTHLATAIDAGDIDYDYKANVGSYTPDAAALAIEFYDGSSVIIGTRTTSSEVDSGCTWTEISLTGTIPANTRKVRLIVLAAYGSGAYNNAYFSKVRMELTSFTEYEVRATQVNALTLVERNVDAEARLTSVIPYALIERSDITEVRATWMGAEMLIERAPDVIDNSPPTSIMVFT